MNLIRFRRAEAPAVDDDCGFCGDAFDPAASDDPDYCSPWCRDSDESADSTFNGGAR